MSWSVGAEAHVPYRLYDYDDSLVEGGHCTTYGGNQQPDAIEFPDGDPPGFDTTRHPIRFVGTDSDGWPLYAFIEAPGFIALHPDFFSAEAGGVRID